jgi:chromosome segregation ATPase
LFTDSETLDAAMSKSQTELRTVKKEVDEVNRQLHRATHELEENRKAAETATKDLRGQRELTFSLESQLREKTNRLATFERSADTLQQQLSRKTADLLDSDNNLKAANVEIAKLKDGIVR